jgi:hypothetical protein
VISLKQKVSVADWNKRKGVAKNNKEDCQ